MHGEFTKKMFWGEAINSFFLVVSKPVALANSFIVIGFLSLADFGNYKLVYSFYLLVAGFSIDFLDSLVLNEMSLYHGEQSWSKIKRIFHEYAAAKIIFGTALTVITFISSKAISHYYGSTVDSWIRILSFLFVIENAKSLLVMYAQYDLKFFISSVNIFIYEIAKLIFILLAYNFYILGVKELLWITVLSNLVVALVIIPSVLRSYRKLSHIESYQTKKMMIWELTRTFGAWSIVRNYFSSFGSNLRPLIIKTFLGIESVAIFSVAVDFLANIKGLLSFNSLKVLLPREISAKRENFQHEFFRINKYLSFIIFILFIMSLIAVPLVIFILFPKYHLSLVHFFIILPSILFFGIYNTYGKVLFALRKQKELVILPVTTFLSVIIFGPLLVHFFGLYGMSVEFFITQALASLCVYFLAVKFMPELKLKPAHIFTINKEDIDLLKETARSIILKLKRKKA